MILLFEFKQQLPLWVTLYIGIALDTDQSSLVYSQVPKLDVSIATT